MPLTQQQRERLAGDLRRVPLGFAALILVGAGLLWLPWCHRAGAHVGALDALFMATSAVCVTGLGTVNVAESFNLGGQIVLLLLVQCGGLGIMTAGTLFLAASGGRLSLADEQFLRHSVGNLRSASPVAVFVHALAFILVIELAGAVALFAAMRHADAATPWPETAWHALFHAVSAFCNAGFSTFPEGLARWRGAALPLGVISALVVAGGIGLLALVNLRYWYFWRRDRRARGYLTLQTRLSLALAAALLAAGTAFTLVAEWNNTLADLPLAERAGEAFFHAAMTRTAGFNTLDLAQFRPETLLGSIVLMFIGGAPGSMAGGIKTITFGLLLLAAWSALRRRPAIVLWRRTIPEKTAFAAVMFAVLAAGFLFLAVLALMLTERGEPAAATPHHWLALTFEAVSAFGTTGLSTGVTPLLTPAGKLVVIVAMFAGRVGLLVLALFLARPPSRSGVRYPIETLTVG